MYGKKKQRDMFSNVKTSAPMDADARNAVTDIGGKRAEVTPAGRVEPGISVIAGISMFYGNLFCLCFKVEMSCLILL